MPTQMSIKGTQAHDKIICTMYVPLTFQLIIERLFFYQISSTLQSIPTNHPQHTLFKNKHNCLHSITYQSYFHHLLTQLLLHHNSHTTNSISSCKIPPQHISPSLHPQHPRTMPSPSHFLQTTHTNHPLSQFFTIFSSLSIQTNYIPHHNPHPKTPVRPPVISQSVPMCSRMKRCTFLSKVGRCIPPQP